MKRHRHTHTDTHRHTDRLNQPQVNTSKDGPQTRGWAIRHSRRIARCREPKQKLNLHSPVEAPRRCEDLGKQPVAPKQVVSVAMVCKGLDCKSRASCEAGCDRFRRAGPTRALFHRGRVLRRVVVLAPLDQQKRSLGLSEQRVALGQKGLPWYREARSCAFPSSLHTFFVMFALKSSLLCLLTTHDTAGSGQIGIAKMKEHRKMSRLVPRSQAKQRVVKLLAAM